MSDQETRYAVLAVVEMLGDAYNQHRRESVLIVRQAESKSLIANWSNPHTYVGVKGQRLTLAQACTRAAAVHRAWEQESQDEHDEDEIEDDSVGG